MHLLPRTALLHSGTGKGLDERQLTLIGDEHRFGAVVKAPLAQLADRHVRYVNFLGRLDQFGLFDAC